MLVGKLNRMVVIKRKGATQDDIGQPVVTLVTVATVWADIRHLNGSETIKGGAETSTAKCSIRIRRRTDVTAAMVVVHGTKTYEIKSVLPDEQARDRMDLVCELIT